jgi:hypothetical protein
MATLELRGKYFTLFLSGDEEVGDPRSTPLFGDMPQSYYYRGEGIVSGNARPLNQFLFLTAPTERHQPLNSAALLTPEPFDGLDGLSRDAVIELLGRDIDRIIDALCDETRLEIDRQRLRQATNNVPRHRRLLPTIRFNPLSRDFLARHLLRKTPLAFGVL